MLSDILKIILSKVLRMCNFIATWLTDYNLSGKETEFSLIAFVGNGWIFSFPSVCLTPHIMPFYLTL